MSWYEHALCKGQAPAFDAIILGEGDRERKARHDAAVRTCYRCPVIVECTAAIDPAIDEGVRGGVVLGSHKNVPAGGGQGNVTRPPLPIPHGKASGAARHRGAGEKPCQLCREAENHDRQDRDRKAS